MNTFCNISNLNILSMYWTQSLDLYKCIALIGVPLTGLTLVFPLLVSPRCSSH